MKTLLVIKASLFGAAGQSSQLADAFTARWRQAHPDGQVLCRDLAADPLPHLNAEAFAGFQAQAAERTPAQHASVAMSDALIAELKQADAVVLALPMYNFTVPSTFKSWMDHVARAGVTFRYTESGPKGLLETGPLYVLCARGGRYSGTENDTQTRLIEMFFGMLGFTDIHFVYAEGLALGEASAAEAVEKAGERIAHLPLVIGDPADG
ncbi:MAG: NAD(P)H-dependent oxidoreductase [Wenzhouxiangella sp.]|nr:NAD(P)H-dependent oxidoreductase [Wenzhouxiangella sp.]